MILEFPNTGPEFSALRDAERWLTDHGYSWGASSADAPTCIMHGPDWQIAKWKNLTPNERSQCHGAMTAHPDFRTGTVRIEIKEVEATA